MVGNRKIQPRLLPETLAYLQDLANTGAYGQSPTDVARTFIEEGIRRALADKIIEIRRASKPVGRHRVAQTGNEP
jgi:hypothetical protein